MRGLMAAAMATMMSILVVAAAGAEQELPNILPDYRTPELRRHELSFGAGLNGSRRYNHDDGYLWMFGGLEDRRTWQDFAHGSTSVSWAYTLDLPETISQSSLQLFLRRDHISTNRREPEWEGDNESYSKRKGMELQAGSSIRRYITGTMFLEIGAEGELNRSVSWGERNFSSRDWDPVSDDYILIRELSTDDGEYRQGTLSLSLGGGFGRVHDVTDARQALYILDNLHGLGCLSRSPSEDEIIELSRLITSLKNERIFDSRVLTIHSLAAIDAWLREQDLLRLDGAVYFTTLVDDWSNAGGVTRQHGSVLRFKLKPDFGNARREDDNRRRSGLPEVLTFYRTESRYRDRGLKASLAWFRYRALTKRLQLDTRAGASFLHRHDRMDRALLRFTDDPDDTIDEHSSSSTKGYGTDFWFAVDCDYHQSTRNSLGSYLLFKHQRSEFTHLGPELDEDRVFRATKAYLRVEWTHYLSMTNRISAGVAQTWTRESTRFHDNQTGQDLPHSRNLLSRTSYSISFHYTAF